MMWLKPMYRPGQQKRRQTVRQDPNRSRKDVDILSQGRHEPPPQAGAHQRTQENQNLWSHASKQLRPVCRGLKISQPGSWPLHNRSASCGIQALKKLGILSPESSAFHFAHGNWTRGFSTCWVHSTAGLYPSYRTLVFLTLLWKVTCGSYPGLLLFRLDSVTFQYPFIRDAIDKILFLSPLLCWS